MYSGRKEIFTPYKSREHIYKIMVKSDLLQKLSSHWEYLNPMRNLKLLEKYQPSPPRH